MGNICGNSPALESRNVTHTNIKRNMPISVQMEVSNNLRESEYTEYNDFGTLNFDEN